MIESAPQATSAHQRIETPLSTDLLLAARTVEDIAHSLLPLAGAMKENGSLSNGAAGIALFLAYAARHFQNRKFLEASGQLLHDAFDWVANTRPSPSLYSGFVGVAWVAQHLRHDLQEFISTDGLVGIDKTLLQYLALQGDRVLEHDLMSGLTGIGVYAMEREGAPSRDELLHVVLSKLRKQARVDELGMAWLAPKHDFANDVRLRYPEGIVNLGVAHGLPSEIALFANATSVNSVKTDAQFMLHGALHWLLAVRQLPPSPSAFPACRGVDEKGLVPMHPKDGNARLAWCYGDPGVLGVLSWACDASSDLSVEHFVDIHELPMLSADFARDPLLKSPCICHGVAGVAHLFHRIARKFSAPQYRTATVQLIDLVLQKRDEVSIGYGGYAEWTTTNSAAPFEWAWVESPGFLAGSAGIGLVLLAAISKDEPAWDRVCSMSGMPTHSRQQPEVDRT